MRLPCQLAIKLINPSHPVWAMYQELSARVALGKAVLQIRNDGQTK